MSSEGPARSGGVGPWPSWGCPSTASRAGRCSARRSSRPSRRSARCRRSATTAGRCSNWPRSAPGWPTSHPERGLIAPRAAGSGRCTTSGSASASPSSRPICGARPGTPSSTPRRCERRRSSSRTGSKGERRWRCWNSHFAAEPFLVGGRFTVADIIVGYAANWAANQGWIDGLDHVSAYVDRLQALPNCTYRRR